MDAEKLYPKHKEGYWDWKQLAQSCSHAELIESALAKSLRRKVDCWTTTFEKAEAEKAETEKVEADKAEAEKAEARDQIPNVLLFLTEQYVGHWQKIISTCPASPDYLS